MKALFFSFNDVGSIAYTVRWMHECIRHTLHGVVDVEKCLRVGQRIKTQTNKLAVWFTFLRVCFLRSKITFRLWLLELHSCSGRFVCPCLRSPTYFCQRPTSSSSFRTSHFGLAFCSSDLFPSAWLKNVMATNFQREAHANHFQARSNKHVAFWDNEQQ